MPVYVDQLGTCLPTPRWPYKSACHMVADTEEELHAFAIQLGLKRAWFQGKSIPHYDLTAGMRARALKLGAIAIDWRELAEKFKSRSIRGATEG